MTSSAKAAGRFGKQDFVYVAAEDVDRAGETVTYRYTNEEDGKTLRRYWTPARQTPSSSTQTSTIALPKASTFPPGDHDETRP